MSRQSTERFKKKDLHDVEQHDMSRRTDNNKNDTKNIASNMIIDNLMQSLSLDAKIGQMGQVDIPLLLMDDDDGNDDKKVIKKKVLNITAAKHYIGELGIGSVLNVVNGWDAKQYRETLIQLNLIAKQYNRLPILWGMDSVHGANFIKDAIVSPQPINIASSFNTSISYRAGIIASRDTRAAGIQWLFSPLIGISLQAKWARVYETFGEDPIVVANMASEMIRGIQQPGEMYPRRAAACAKHYIGYSNPHSGHDRSPSWIPTRHLYQYFVPPWKKVLTPKTTTTTHKNNVKNNSDDNTDTNIDYSIAMTVMESYTEIDGVPVVANNNLQDYLLRYRLQFNGVLITDYSEMLNLFYWHHVSDSKYDANLYSLTEGTIDMSMIPLEADVFIKSLKYGIANDVISIDRINESLKRILQLKYDLEILNENETLTMIDNDINKIGSDIPEALSMTEDSIILTKNENNVLPIAINRINKSIKIHITGPTANSIRYQCGGWTGTWQGDYDEKTWFQYGQTIVDGMKSIYTTKNNNNVTVSYTCGVNVTGMDCDDNDEDIHHDDNLIDSVKHWVGLTPSNSIARAIHEAKNSDYVIICIGEESNTEKPGDINSLYLPTGQYDLVKAIRQNIPINTKIILIYLGGRPRIIRDMVDISDAVFVAFLPGPLGGTAIANIISGVVNPNAKLPITYPAFDDTGGIPYYHSVSDQCTEQDPFVPMPHYSYIPCIVQWPFGYGLSYTSFEYTNFQANGGIDQDLNVSVVVKNTGNVDGKEVILFYTFDLFRRTTPEYKRLRVFDKVYIPVGKSITIQKTIPIDELRFIGPHDDTHYILDPNMQTYIGVGSDTDCRASDVESNPLCILLQSKNNNNNNNNKRDSSNNNRKYNAACEATCLLWSDSGCYQEYNSDSSSNAISMYDTDSCLDLCVSISDDGWGWNYVNCIEDVIRGMKMTGNNIDNITNKVNGREGQCWKMTSLCRNIHILETGSLNQYGNRVLTTTLYNGIGGGSTSNNNNYTSQGLHMMTYIVSGFMSLMFVMSLVFLSQHKKLNVIKNIKNIHHDRYDGIQFT